MRLLSRLFVVVILMAFSFTDSACYGAKPEKALKKYFKEAIKKGKDLNGVYGCEIPWKERVYVSLLYSYADEHGYKIVYPELSKPERRWDGRLIEPQAEKVYFMDSEDSRTAQIDLYRKVYKAKPGFDISKIKGRGYMITDGHPIGKVDGTFLISQVDWTGRIKNGLIDGDGIGFVTFGSKSYLISGRFDSGFPASEYIYI